MRTILLAIVEAGDTAGGFLHYLPLLFVFAVFIWMISVFWRNAQRSKPLRDRSLAHMDRLEAKTDEMVTLLREIRDKLSAD
jgi:large-conductance mechanosensitive channel